MRKFIIRLLLVLLVPVLFIVFTFVFWLNGYIDPYYLLVTTPKQSSMILGTSRSSMGLIPSLFELNGYDNVYNYSFSIGFSPWGESYYNSICKKLDTTSNDGLFVLTVDPFSISSDVLDDGTEDIQPTFISILNSVTASPNWEYIYMMDVKPWRYALNVLHIEKRNFCLHEDGWFENYRVWDEEAETAETRMKVREYRLIYAKRKFSNHRFSYLEKTIQLLKPHGRVVLVSVPTSADMYAYELEYMPSFDSLMIDLSRRSEVEYYNMGQLSGSYRTFDGNHLIPEDAKLFTQSVCDSLKNNTTSALCNENVNQ